MSIADRLERQCRIVDACQALDGAAQAVASLTGERDAADLSRLAPVVDASVSPVRTFADSYDTWAELAAEPDVLLSRELRRLAGAMRALAADAARPRALAADFAESEPEEALVS